jgi:hypothetical protein
MQEQGSACGDDRASNLDRNLIVGGNDIGVNTFAQLRIDHAGVTAGWSAKRSGLESKEFTC